MPIKVLLVLGATVLGFAGLALVGALVVRYTRRPSETGADEPARSHGVLVATTIVLFVAFVLFFRWRIMSTLTDLDMDGRRGAPSVDGGAQHK